MRPVQSVQADQAAALVMRELGEYRRRESASSVASYGRIRRRRATATLPTSYGAVVSIVSIAEEFFASTLRTNIEDAFSVATRLAQDAEAEVLRGIETWPGRQRAAKRWFAVDSSGITPYSELLAFVEARNAIIHGLGRLTRKQSADGGKAVLQKLATVGISEAGGVLSIDAAAVRSCAIAARAAIQWFDVAFASAVLQPPA